MLFTCGRMYGVTFFMVTTTANRLLPFWVFLLETFCTHQDQVSKAFDLKPLTRKQRADLLKKNKPDFFAHYSERAKEVLNLILEKYVDYGLNQIRPDIISVEPIAQQGNPIEIINEFGGIDEFKKAINELQTLLYAEAA